jgi:hypothetical protein
MCGPFRKTIVDLLCPEEAWQAYKATFSMPFGAREHQKHRNIALEVEPGASAMIPRPSEGLVYAGRGTGKLELLDEPPWAAKYVALRRKQKCNGEPDAPYQTANVAQCWALDGGSPIPFFAIPAWIRHSLFRRATFGRIGKWSQLQLDPYPILNRLIDHLHAEPPEWTDAVLEVERRLVGALTPNAFEHLCVSLVQLEYPG